MRKIRSISTLMILIVACLFTATTLETFDQPRFMHIELSTEHSSDKVDTEQKEVDEFEDPFKNQDTIRITTAFRNVRASFQILNVYEVLTPPPEKAPRTAVA